MAKPKPDDELVSATTLAKRLGLVVTSVSRLAAQGALVKNARGQYLAWASVRAYVAQKENAFVSRASPASLARAELLKIQAERAAFAFKREQAQLVDAGEMEDAVRALILVSRAAMLSLSSRVAGALPGLTREDATRVDDIVRACLTGIATADPAAPVAEQAAAEARRVKRGK
jgi:phage terminase Nu1 subunit (DNA packaging protein)